MSIFEEFKKFALKGNLLDMAVGIMIGAAFGTVINSLVNDILMPPLGLLLGRVDFTNLYINLTGGSYASLADAQASGAATINYGIFINNIISFLIVAFVMFFLVRGFNQWAERKKMDTGATPEAPITRQCPYCQMDIPLAARRCPHCTSNLEGE